MPYLISTVRSKKDNPKQTQILESTPWIPDSLSVELRFRIPIALTGFQIPFGELPGFRIPQVKTFRIPESGLLYMERDSVRFSRPI